jgi:hypothetical protein
LLFPKNRFTNGSPSHADIILIDIPRLFIILKRTRLGNSYFNRPQNRKWNRTWNRTGTCRRPLQEGKKDFLDSGDYRKHLVFQRDEIRKRHTPRRKSGHGAICTSCSLWKMTDVNFDVRLITPIIEPPCEAEPRRHRLQLLLLLLLLLLQRAYASPAAAVCHMLISLGLWENRVDRKRLDTLS